MCLKYRKLDHNTKIIDLFGFIIYVACTSSFKILVQILRFPTIRCNVFVILLYVKCACLYFPLSIENVLIAIKISPKML